MFFGIKKWKRVFKWLEIPATKRCILWAANVFRVQIKGSLIQAHSLLHGHFLGTPPCYADNWSRRAVLADTSTSLAEMKNMALKVHSKGETEREGTESVSGTGKTKNMSETQGGLCAKPPFRNIYFVTWFQILVFHTNLVLINFPFLHTIT